MTEQGPVSAPAPARAVAKAEPRPHGVVAAGLVSAFLLSRAARPAAALPDEPRVSRSRCSLQRLRGGPAAAAARDLRRRGRSSARRFSPGHARGLPAPPRAPGLLIADAHGPRPRPAAGLRLGLRARLPADGPRPALRRATPWPRGSSSPWTRCARPRSSWRGSRPRLVGGEHRGLDGFRRPRPERHGRRLSRRLHHPGRDRWCSPTPPSCASTWPGATRAGWKAASSRASAGPPGLALAFVLAGSAVAVEASGPPPTTCSWCSRSSSRSRGSPSSPSTRTAWPFRPCCGRRWWCSSS